MFLFQTPRRLSKLFCRYYDNNRNPRLVLAPIKQQDEWDRPYIVRYIDIISDTEIEKVKQLAKPRVSKSEQRNVTSKIFIMWSSMSSGGEVNTVRLVDGSGSTQTCTCERVHVCVWVNYVPGLTATQSNHLQPRHWSAGNSFLQDQQKVRQSQ